jgi:hypothetical protein
VSDEPDNLVLRHLRELRTHLDSRLDKVDGRSDESDVRFVKIETRLADVEGLARTTLTEIVAVARRLEHIETGLRVSERLAALEEKFAEFQRRAGS